MVGLGSWVVEVVLEEVERVMMLFLCWGWWG